MKNKLLFKKLYLIYAKSNSTEESISFKMVNKMILGYWRGEKCQSLNGKKVDE